MYSFGYHRPDSIAKAASLASALEDAKLLAGGQTLIPVLKQRLARPSDIIDIAKLPELQGIYREQGTLVIHAAVTHATVARSELVRGTIPALAHLASDIGDPQVRNRGTLGGSIANNDPTADYPAALLALGALVQTTRRTIAAADFFTGLFSTALEPGEIVVKVSFPIPQAASYEKFPSPASRYALAGVFVARSGAGTRLAVTGVGPVVFRQTKFEEALDAGFRPAALDGIAIDASDFSADLHASAAYRAQLLTVVAKCAVQKLT
jgi:carbon-monoxide dehydrogenase medium subunit